MNKDIIDQLYNSIVGDDFAKVYETDASLKEILEFFTIYKPEYGTNGIKIEDYSRQFFAHQLLFGKAVEKLPETEQEKDAITTGFVGDFNLLYDELVK